MTEYLKFIDAEKIEDVYGARFRELDRFEENAREKHRMQIEKAADNIQAIAEADAGLQRDLERFEKNRADCRANKKGVTF